MKRKLIIEVGMAAVRLLELRLAAGTATVLDAAVVEYAVPWKSGVDAESLAEALREGRGTDRFRGREAVVALSPQLTWTHATPLPPISPAAVRLPQLVAYEARQAIPLPLDQVSWDWGLVPRPDGDPEVVFAVAKERIMTDLVAGLRGAGLRARRIDCGLAALYSLARANGIGDDGAEMLVDVGSSGTMALICDGDQLFFRHIGIGGEAITRAIGRQTDLGWGGAEQLKLRYGFASIAGVGDEVEPGIARVVATATQRVVSKLAMELERTMAIWQAQAGRERPSKAYLTGGASQLPFFDDYLVRRLRVTVDLLVPWAPAATALPGLPAHRLATAAGVAVQEAGQEALAMDLSPVALKKGRRWRRLLPYAASAAVVWLGLLLTAWLWIGERSEVAAVEVDLARERVVALQEDAAAVRQLARAAEVRQRQAGRLARLARHRAAVGSWWDAVAEATPDGVVVTRMAPLKERERREVRSIFATAEASGPPMITGLRLEGRLLPTVAGDERIGPTQRAEAFLTALQLRPEFREDETRFVAFAAMAQSQDGHFAVDVSLRNPLAEWGLER